jgi:hypothetical protein
MKDWRRHRVATLFGEVRVKRPRLVCGPRLWRDRLRLATALPVDPRTEPTASPAVRTDAVLGSA